MIICDRLDWARERHAFHPVVDQAISWIAETDLSQLETGKYAILPVLSGAGDDDRTGQCA